MICRKLFNNILVIPNPAAAGRNLICRFKNKAGQVSILDHNCSLKLNLNLKGTEMVCEDRSPVGPIVTPSEWGSLPVRVTMSCPWNRCEFCPAYKGKAYEPLPIDIILKYIEISQAMPRHLYRVGERPYESAFLQDADPIALPTADLIRIIQKIKEVFPTITRITSYGRAYSLARKSLPELKELRGAGFIRVYRGLESGYDALLRYMKKGTTKKILIESGIKVKQAGIELSDCVMPGLGGNLRLEGEETWQRHAEETARVINAVNPDFIRLRTLFVHKKTPLWEKVQRGEFKQASNQNVMREIRLFIEKLQGITGEIDGEFISNVLLFRGKMPADKKRIISKIDKYLAAPQEIDKEYEARMKRFSESGYL